VPQEAGSLSYRALFALPSMPRVLASLFLSRLALQTVRIALILFALAEFDSPALAGIVTFASMAPGLVVSPIAGALLDRHGRVRLIAVDFVVALAALSAIGLLALVGMLSPEAFVAIAVITSFTAPLSMTGLRTLFPLLVPEPLWERANAMDANAFVVASMLGPLVAAACFTLFGPAGAMIAIGVPFGLAAVVLRGVHDPDVGQDREQPLLASAWEGLRYTLGNPTLRALAVAISTLTFSGGIVSIVVPLVVLDELGGSELAVGLVFGLAGVAGLISVLAFGRRDTRGREWRLIVRSMLLLVPATAILWLAGGSLAVSDPLLGLAMVALSLLLTGLLEGPLDVGLFTLRQRRTDPAWFGRAFAISMALNVVGFPIGAAVAGGIAEVSLDLAILAGVVSALGAAILAAVLVPRDEPPALATATGGQDRGASGSDELVSGGSREVEPQAG
jgi:MFS family permease